MTDGTAGDSARPWLGLAAEWRERTIMLVARELDLIRNDLTSAREGLRFDESSIEVFDNIAEALLEALASGGIEFDIEARKRSLDALYHHDAEVPTPRSEVALVGGPWRNARSR